MRVCDLWSVVPRVDELAETSVRWPYNMGIELELENVTLNGQRHGLDSYGDEVNPNGWCRHSDASLRNGIEFVLYQPMSGERLETAIDSWYSMGYDFEVTARTSTHIHMNVSVADVEVLRSMICIVYVIEDAIYSLTEEGRKWAGYSMPLTEMSTARLRNILNSPSDSVLRDNVVPRRNAERYYGFNFNVSRHGTVEFRYFPGGPRKAELESWLDLITLIRKTAERYRIADLESTINSAEDLRVFLLNELGEWGERFLSTRSITDFYLKFLDVMALATDDINPERASSVVMINPTLVSFIKSNYCGNNEAVIAYLDKSLAGVPATTFNDLGYFISNAHTMAMDALPREERLRIQQQTPRRMFDMDAQVPPLGRWEEEDDEDEYEDPPYYEPEPEARPTSSDFMDTLAFDILAGTAEQQAVTDAMAQQAAAAEVLRVQQEHERRTLERLQRMRATRSTTTVTTPAVGARHEELTWNANPWRISPETQQRLQAESAQYWYNTDDGSVRRLDNEESN